MKLESGRELRQWEVCDPKRMAEMSQAAIEYAFIDAKVDIMALCSLVGKIRELAEDGMCHGLLADDRCRVILDLIDRND